VRIALFTNNYLPFCGGVTISVETLRRGLEARGHEVWVMAPRFRGSHDGAPGVIRYPSIPATTYPEFPLAIPYAPAVTGTAVSPRAPTTCRAALTSAGPCSMRAISIDLRSPKTGGWESGACAARSD